MLIGMPILLAPVILTACTGASLYAPFSQSNFTYPNSDVVPPTHVKATVTRSYILPFQNADIPDATVKRDAYIEALKSSGGDVIIDGDFSIRSKMIPLFVVMVVNVEDTVEGTAAKIRKVGFRPKE